MVEIDRLAEHRAGSSKKRQVAFAAQKLLALQQLPIGLAAMVAVGFHLKPLDFAGKCCGHLFGQQPEGGVDMPLGQDCLQRPDDFTACILDQGNRHAGFVEHGRNDAVIRPQHGVAVIGPLMRQCKGAVRRKDGEGPVSDKAVGDILDEGLHDRRDRLPVNPCRANECDAGFSLGFSAVALFRLGGDRYRGGQTLYSPPQRHGFRFRGTPLLAELLHQKLVHALAGADVSDPRIGRHGGAVGFFALRLDLAGAFGKPGDIVRTGATKTRQFFQKLGVAGKEQIPETTALRKQPEIKMILSGLQPLQQLAAEFKQRIEPPHRVFGPCAGKEDGKVGALRQLAGLKIVSFGQKDRLILVGKLLQAQDQLPQVAESPFLLDIFPQQRCGMLAGKGLVRRKDEGGGEGEALGRKKCLPHRITARGAKKPDRYQFSVPSHFRPLMNHHLTTCPGN